jgi:hypothetical protein
MFYYIVSNLSFIKSITDSSKFLKILIIGSICYIVLHAILFSNIGDNIEVLRKYRNYVYYLWVADCALTYGKVQYVDRVEKNLVEYEESESEENKDKSSEEESESESSVDSKEVNNLTREQVLEKLKEENNTPSPFMKKDEVEQAKPQINPTNTGMNGSATSIGTTLNVTSPIIKPSNPVNNEQNKENKLEQDKFALQEVPEIESDTEIPVNKE